MACFICGVVYNKPSEQTSGSISGSVCGWSGADSAALDSQFAMNWRLPFRMTFFGRVSHSLIFASSQSILTFGYDLDHIALSSSEMPTNFKRERSKTHSQAPALCRARFLELSNACASRIAGACAIILSFLILSTIGLELSVASSVGENVGAFFEKRWCWSTKFKSQMSEDKIFTTVKPLVLFLKNVGENVGAFCCVFSIFRDKKIEKIPRLLRVYRALRY